MNRQLFETEVEEVLQSIRDTLVKKGKEYAPVNPFQNFIDGANISKQRPEVVLDGYLLKHYVSYRDILEKIKQGEYPSKELVEEKLGDILTYFVLQKILMLNNDKVL